MSLRAAIGSIAGRASAATCLFAVATTAAWADDLRIAFRTDAPPFSSRIEGAPETGRFDEVYGGFAVDLCSRIVDAVVAERPGTTVVHSGVAADNRFPATDVESVAFDLLCDPTSMTEERLSHCSFSIPFFLTGIAAASRQGGLDLEAMTGMRLGYVGGTTAEKRLADLWEERTGRRPGFRSEKDYAEAVDAVVDDRLDAVFGDQVLLQRAVEDRGAGLEVSEDVLSVDLYSFCVNPDRPDLLRAANGTLARMFRDHEIYELIGQHFDGRGASAYLAHHYLVFSLPRR